MLLAGMMIAGTAAKIYGDYKESKGMEASQKARAEAIRRKIVELRLREEINTKAAYTQGELNQMSYANNFAGAGIKRQGSTYTGTLMELADRAQQEISTIRQETAYEIGSSMEEINDLDNTISGIREARGYRTAGTLLGGAMDFYKASGYPGMDTNRTKK